MGLRAIFVAFAVTCMSVTAASASTILYDFNDNLGDNSTTLTYSVGGEDLTVEASRRDNAGLVRNINRGGNGLGVSPGREGGRLGTDDVLTFTIDSGREISGLIATIWERGSQDEEFSVIVNGITTTFTVPGNGAGTSVQTFDLTSLFSTGTNTFSIVGESNGAGNRGVRLGSVQVTLTSVPVPAGGLLLLTGFGVLALTRRKA